MSSTAPVSLAVATSPEPAGSHVTVALTVPDLDLAAAFYTNVWRLEVAVRAARVLYLRDHGRKPGDKLFWNTEIAYKYKMSSMQAALGLAQLERIEELDPKINAVVIRWFDEARASAAGGLPDGPPCGPRSSGRWLCSSGCRTGSWPCP